MVAFLRTAAATEASKQHHGKSNRESRDLAAEVESLSLFKRAAISQWLG